MKRSARGQVPRPASLGLHVHLASILPQGYLWWLFEHMLPTAALPGAEHSEGCQAKRVKQARDRLLTASGGEGGVVQIPEIPLAKWLFPPCWIISLRDFFIFS